MASLLKPSNITYNEPASKKVINEYKDLSNALSQTYDFSNKYIQPSADDLKRQQRQTEAEILRRNGVKPSTPKMVTIATDQDNKKIRQDEKSIVNINSLFNRKANDIEVVK